MHPYKVKFIESSFSSHEKHASKYGMLDGHQSAINLEAYLAEEHENGYVIEQILPFISNEAASKYHYPIPVTAGYTVIMKKNK